MNEDNVFGNVVANPTDDQESALDDVYEIMGLETNPPTPKLGQFIKVRLSLYGSRRFEVPWALVRGFIGEAGFPTHLRVEIANETVFPELHGVAFEDEIVVERIPTADLQPGGVPRIGWQMVKQ